MKKNKACLITGGATGLGYEFAKLAVDDGFDLILIDIDSEKLVEAKAALEGVNNHKITVISKDLCEQNIAQEIYKEIKDENIEMLINNAGFGVFGKFCETEWSSEERMMYLHMMTSTHLTKLLLKNMVAKGSGKILNIASLAAFQPGPLMAIYYASKSFLLSFTEALAREIKGTGVTISVLCPGPTMTNFQGVVSKNAKKNKISVNMANAQAVANNGYKAFKNGEIVVIPGIFNKILAFLPRLLPRNCVASIVYKIQTANRN